MLLLRNLCILIGVFALCAASVLAFNAAPVRAAGPEKESKPYSTSWGNSAPGGTAASKGAWGKSNLMTNCATGWGNSTWLQWKDK